MNIHFQLNLNNSELNIVTMISLTICYIKALILLISRFPYGDNIYLLNVCLFIDPCCNSGWLTLYNALVRIFNAKILSSFHDFQISLIMEFQNLFHKLLNPFHYRHVGTYLNAFLMVGSILLTFQTRDTFFCKFCEIL